jgi:hypothetical protein
MVRLGSAVGLVLLLLTSGVMAGCQVGPSHLLEPDTIARQVGAHYGDPHARVVKARSDVTEANSTPMYLMTVAGQVRKDGVQASTIAFSALATRLYVWDVRAFDGAGQQVWSDDEWNGCSSSCGSGAPTGAG